MKNEEFYKLLQKRRSIRQFKTEAPPKEVLQRILGAAMEAPSAKNRQNWRFFVVSGKKRDEYLKYSQKSWLNIKDVLKERLKPSLYEFTERFFYNLGGAPVLIFCYSFNAPDEKYLSTVGSVYMAIENLNLAAFVEGLGCCTMGAPLEIREDVDKFLGVTELEDYKKGQLELLAGLAIGYPDHEPPKAPRQIEGRITWLED
jgi:nitroreductase